MPRQYSISPYRKNWIVRFREQRTLIRKILGKNALEIHHVGSTSIPGMSAKPIVDVLAIVGSLARVDGSKQEFQKLGYTLRKDYVTTMSRMLEKFKGSTKLYNIHLLPKSHPEARRLLDTKNYFIAHPAEVRKYETLKKSLYKRFPDDYAAYRKGKTNYLNDVTQKAKQWVKK